jgi:hypothetical protein
MVGKRACHHLPYLEIYLNTEDSFLKNKIQTNDQKDP